MTGHRILLALPLVLLAGLALSVFVIARASSELVSPARRPLQDYHREWLEQPAAHGISIQKFQQLSEFLRPGVLDPPPLQHFSIPVDHAKHAVALVVIDPNIHGFLTQ
jgi:hypothetical protein